MDILLSLFMVFSLQIICGLVLFFYFRGSSCTPLTVQSVRRWKDFHEDRQPEKPHQLSFTRYCWSRGLIRDVGTAQGGGGREREEDTPLTLHLHHHILAGIDTKPSPSKAFGLLLAPLNPGFFVLPTVLLMRMYGGLVPNSLKQMTHL